MRSTQPRTLLLAAVGLVAVVALGVSVALTVEQRGTDDSAVPDGGPGPQVTQLSDYIGFSSAGEPRVATPLAEPASLALRWVAQLVGTSQRRLDLDAELAHLADDASGLDEARATAASAQIADVVFLDRILVGNRDEVDLEALAQTFSDVGFDVETPLAMQRTRIRVELAMAGVASDAPTPTPELACELADRASGGALEWLSVLSFEATRPGGEPCVAELHDRLTSAPPPGAVLEQVRSLAQFGVVDDDYRTLVAGELAHEFERTAPWSPFDVERLGTALLVAGVEPPASFIAAADRVQRTEGRVVDEIGGVFTLDALLFSQLDEVAGHAIWSSSAEPAAIVSAVASDDAAPEWAEVVATGVVGTNLGDAEAVARSLAAPCDAESDQVLDAAPQVPFIVLVRVALVEATAACGSHSVDAVFASSVAAADNVLGVTASVRTWIAAFVACRYSSDDGTERIRELVRNESWQRVTSWSLSSNPDDGQAMFEEYAVGWIQTLLAGAGCDQLTWWAT